eukprot:316737-Rhodomonas_salina.1
MAVGLDASLATAGFATQPQDVFKPPPPHPPTSHTPPPRNKGFHPPPNVYFNDNNDNAAPFFFFHPTSLRIFSLPPPASRLSPKMY